MLALRTGTSGERAAILDHLIRRYWKPIYCYLRRAGCSEADAKDLVQGFFAFCLERDFFDQADPARGRFRSFLLASLEHFWANARRAAAARKRCPPQGILLMEDLAGDGESTSGGFQPAGGESPEAVFHRAWVSDLTGRVLQRLEEDFRATGKEAHYELFRLRLVLPALEGAAVPPLREVARRLGMSEKQAANCILTARRAFQRLLEAEIRAYANSEEEVAEEVRDLFSFMAEPPRC